MQLELTINSRVLKQSYNFWVCISERYNSGYVYLVSDNCPGTLGQQICDNNGNCLTATPDSFQAVCHRWYRQEMRNWR